MNNTGTNGYEIRGINEPKYWAQIDKPLYQMRSIMTRWQSHQIPGKIFRAIFNGWEYRLVYNFVSYATENNRQILAKQTISLINSVKSFLTLEGEVAELHEAKPLGLARPGVGLVKDQEK